MYPASTTVKNLFANENRQTLRITGTDANNHSINITDANIPVGGFNIDRYVCNSERLEMGTAVAAEMTLKLDNHTGAFSNITFEGTELYVEIGIANWSLSTPTVYYVPCGYFTPDEQPRALNTITIHALDRMMKFDQKVGNITFPISVRDLVAACCTACGVTLATTISSSYPNYNLSIAGFPEDMQDLTYRTVIQWCAALLGANAYVDWEGKLRIEWYSNTSNYTTTIANRFTSDLQEADIHVSGFTYKDANDVIHISGTDSYTLDLTGNGLVTADNADTILTNIYNKRTAYTYRPFTATVVSAPYLWPMDVISFQDKDGNGHTTALTNVNITINGNMAIAAKGVSQKENSYATPGAFSSRQAAVIQQIQQASTNNLNEAIDNATKLITGENGGYVRFMYNNGDLNEILIMDQPDVQTATKVWRWNNSGFGYSSSGYNGPYTTAITQDGSIVANFITVGTLDGNFINAKQLSIVDADNNVVATFDASVTIGDTSSTHAIITNNSFSLYVDSSNKAFSVSLENDADGIAHVVQEFTADGSTTTFDLRYIVPLGEVEYGDITYDDVPLAYVYVNGTLLAPLNGYTTADVDAPGGAYSFTQIVFNPAPTANTTVRVEYETETPIVQLLVGTKLSSSDAGRFSVILGCESDASGDYSVSEGLRTVASGFGSHAEGAPYYNSITDDYTDSPIASGDYSHAEGCGAVASGEYSHAEGFRTLAAHKYSHAQGEGTITGRTHQFVFGQYNVQRSSHAEVVGWGTSSTPDDIRRLSTGGNMWIKGTLTQGSDARLKTECGEVPDVSSVRARVFKWNDNLLNHDDLTHIGYFAQDVEKVAPYLVTTDEVDGRKSLDYIAFLCAKVECLERRIAELERNGGDS